MSNNRTILLATTATSILVALVLSDPAHARRDTTVDVCPPGIVCDVPSPGHGRDGGGPIGGGDDSSDDDSSDDDSSEDDVRDDVDSDDTSQDTSPE
jgi:hypothetical protein